MGGGARGGVGGGKEMGRVGVRGGRGRDGKLRQGIM